MDVLTYLSKAVSASFMGFFPLFEIYLAVPAALAMRLDYVSAVVWPVLGNFLVVPLVIFFSGQLKRIKFVRRWLARPGSERWEAALERYGVFFVLLMTPILGVWLMTALAQTAGMKPFRLMVAALLSISLYGVIIAMGVGLGLDWFTSQE